MKALIIIALSLALCGCGNRSNTNVHASEATQPSVAAHPKTESGWQLQQTRNKMDGSQETTLTLLANSGGAGIGLRCRHRKTEVIVSTNAIVDNGHVRIKFDDAPPVSQSWDEATNYGALFAPDAISFARRIQKAHTFLFEFNQFQHGAKILEFHSQGLDLSQISQTCDWASVDKNKAEQMAALKDELSEHVNHCFGAHPEMWCWTDPTLPGVVLQHYFPTREAALQDAVKAKRMHKAFY
jgi:hypothetical protein